MSPILANLFLHYAFDLWVTRHLPGVRFARYADDAVLHCKSRRQAEYVLERIRQRFQACHLELHPGKTRIVYCKDINRTEDNPDIQFTFLGYTFQPRKAVDKYGRVYVNFSPAVSRDALKAMRQTIRGWRVQLKNDKSLTDLSAMLGPILRGWQQYYGHFHGSALKSVWRRVNRSLIGWLMRKHKKLAGHKTRAAETLKRLAQRQPRAFVHWPMGSCRRMDDGSRMSREVHVRFCEGPKVKLLRPTHPYIPMARGFVYLVAVVDWFSRRVLSHRVSITMEAGFCVEALEEAIGKHGKPEIFNSDQGSQFTSEAFTGVLEKNGIAISMDGKGSWRDNVFIERLWRSVKYEGGLPHGLRHRRRSAHFAEPVSRLFQSSAPPFEP
jgi:transposase InsO family protein